MRQRDPNRLQRSVEEQGAFLSTTEVRRNFRIDSMVPRIKQTEIICSNTTEDYRLPETGTDRRKLEYHCVTGGLDLRKLTDVQFLISSQAKTSNRLVVLKNLDVNLDINRGLENIAENMKI